MYKKRKDADPEKAQRVMKAMMGMVKIDIAGLKQAANQPYSRV